MDIHGHGWTASSTLQAGVVRSPPAVPGSCPDDSHNRQLMTVNVHKRERWVSPTPDRDL